MEIKTHYDLSEDLDQSFSEEASSGGKQFWKCYLSDFVTILKSISSKQQLDILIYILSNMQASNNLFVGTYSEIIRNTGVCRQTVASTMTKFQNHLFLKKIKNGVWLINPNIFVKGTDIKRQKLLLDGTLSK